MEHAKGDFNCKLCKSLNSRKFCLGEAYIKWVKLDLNCQQVHLCNNIRLFFCENPKRKCIQQRYKNKNSQGKQVINM